MTKTSKHFWIRVYAKCINVNVTDIVTYTFDILLAASYVKVKASHTIYRYVIVIE